MEPEILWALIGASSLVVVVFMREILGPFIAVLKNRQNGHEPDKPVSDNIGKLFSLLNDFRMSVMTSIKDSESDHGKIMKTVSRVERWLEPNSDGQQTWKGGEIASAVERNNTIMREMLTEQKEQTAVIRRLADGLTARAPCEPLTPGGKLVREYLVYSFSS